MADDAGLTQRWRDEFGANLRFKGLFGISELHTSDVKAINHIVTNSSSYQKAPSARFTAQRLLGRGILFVELDEHKRHKGYGKFPKSPVSDAEAIQIFVEKALQTYDSMSSVKQARLPTTIFFRLITITTGFNYQFDSLEAYGKSSELNDVFTELFHSAQSRRYARF
ncbi:hypothetical protein DFH06DRAFT_1362292 [Mycena polygramma]|nr:hypothetical protein DFH06DRAFT_1362292 [Mycena polygramma]